MTSGHCLCGKVRFTFTGKPVKVAHCYCESCRRTTSSPMTTFVIVKRDSVTFSGEPHGVYRSSPGVERWFCKGCGSPMAYLTDRFGETLDLYAASLDQPNLVQPELHVHESERLPWIELEDSLPRHARGSGD